MRLMPLIWLNKQSPAFGQALFAKSKQMKATSDVLQLRF
jgi:hypothetical protein